MAETKSPEHAGGTQYKEGVLSVLFPESFVYSNCSALASSFMDFHLSFAEAMPDQTVVAKVGIVMPAEHAVRLAISLIQQLSYVERAFGDIRNPEWQFFKAEVMKGSVDTLNVPQALYELRERASELSEEDQAFVRTMINEFESNGAFSRANTLKVVDLYRSLNAKPATPP